MLTLDHIALAAETLDAGARATETALGRTLAPGGKHAEMGTHNRLMSLGPSEYLEVIAIDPGAAAPVQPRWFGLDTFAGPPRIAAWIARVPDIEAARAAAPDGIGRPWPLERGDLRWTMAIPQNGVLPFGGLFPALIEWTGPNHPAPRLPDHGLRLTALTLHSPEADALRAALAPLCDDPRIAVVSAGTPRITAVLDTPEGLLTL